MANAMICFEVNLTLQVRMKDVIFKPLNESDIDMVYNWLCLPHVAQRWGGVPEYPKVFNKYSRYVHSDYVFSFIIYLNDKAIGYIHYYFANRVGKGWWPNAQEGTVGIDIFIGEIEYINKGYGKQILKKFVCVIRSDPKIKKIILEVAPDNSRAKICYEKVGFSYLEEADTPNGKALVLEMPIN